VENIKDAIRLHIEDRLADGEEIPEHTTLSHKIGELYR
jgi:predicted RNase H-like HicB family nuclease